MTGDPAPDALARAEGLFLSLAAPRLAALGSARARLLAGQAPQDALAEIGAVAHKIAGTAATLGHRRLGHCAARVDRLTTLGAAPQAVLAELDPLLDALAALAATPPSKSGSPLSDRPW